MRVLDYNPELKPHFKSINKEWIDEMFSMEAFDLEILDNPEAIIAGGGAVWFVEVPGLGVVGSCALIKTSPGEFELSKMGTLKSARGLGVGDLMLRHVRSQRKNLGVDKLYLLTNSRCEAAIHLYRKHGFVDDAEIMAAYQKKYQRCDIAMSLPMHNQLWQPTLQGSDFIARPLESNDFEILYAAASDPLIWQQHPQSNRYKRENFSRYFNSGIDSRGALIVLEKTTGEVLGCSRYYEFEPENSSVAIGYTFLVRKCWGSSYNRELKTLMLDYAFKMVDTVFFHVDEKNIRSMKAVGKIGASEVERKSVIDDDGKQRTDVVFSISKIKTPPRTNPK